jgi:8-amino-7-oxononanoate synthase
MSDAIRWTRDELNDWNAAGLLRRRRTITAQKGGWCLVDGRRLQNFAGNDYLDLAHDPRVIAAAEQALREGGAVAGASALISGHTQWHAALEERLARFERQPAAILFPAGFAANMGTIGALAGKGDVVCSDRLNHASLVDGSRLCGALVRVYDHLDLPGLERELAQAADARRRLIVTDSVFSMDGDLAPLPELCDLAERHQAMLLVDEAHGTGVYGASGRGVAELQVVEERGVIRVGTLSKAVGSLGGFVTGPQCLIDWLWNRARTQMYSTALPPAVCAAAAAAIDIIESEPERRERLARAGVSFRKLLADRGIETPPQSRGPIVPILLNSPERAMEVATRLEEAGYLVGAIRPPTVPSGTSRLRIALNSAVTDDDLRKLSDRLVLALAAGNDRTTA